MERSYKIGGNILDNLTTGMYKDSEIIYREYIQNACDQIDKAVKMGILKEDEGRIDIFVDADNQVVTIEDNATGIPAAEFVSTLGDIANSSKQLGVDKGFRGIGRLAGLAYCDNLIFTSTYKGEKIISKMECDAKLMRKMLNEIVEGHKHEALEILQSIYSFSTEITNDIDSHFFKIEMVGVSDKHNILLDLKKIKTYLSFVAPVDYNNKFYLTTMIKDYAKEHQHKIEEYKIRVNGEPVFKGYAMNYKSRQNGNDSIHDLMFKEFKDSNGRPLAWMWYGLSEFKAAIPDDCEMRGIRIRSGNIQIGDGLSLQGIFNETRGAKYFIGELFTLSKGLIPNSQRDYFNDTEARFELEEQLKKYAKDVLYPLYRKGSQMNGIIKQLEQKTETELKLTQKLSKGAISKGELEEDRKKLESIATEKKKLIDSIDDLIQTDQDSESGRVIAKIAVARKASFDKRFEELKKEYEQIEPPNGQKSTGRRKHCSTRNDCKITFRANRLNSLNRNEQKLIGRVFEVISASIQDDDIKEKVIKAIEDEFK